jgi:L-cysteine/cystine lyase
MRAEEDFISGPAYLEGADLFRRQAEANASAREAAASLIGAEADDIALTQNTTHGMNLGVGSVDWKEGDEVVSTSTEHPGCLAPLHNAAQGFEVEVKLVEPPVTVEKIEAILMPHSRLIALSHVDWTTGDVLPLREICAIARDRRITTLVDGAQSVGAISVDAPAIGADMYAFTGHKWVLGPEGIGALYVRPDYEAPSTNVGYLSIEDPASFDPSGDYDFQPGARRFEASTMSPVLAAGFAAAAEAAYERGAEACDGILRRANLLTNLLSELSNVTLRSPRPAQSGLVSFEVGNMGAQEVAEKLLERRFVLRFIPGSKSYVRASTHLFNTEEELEVLAEAVSDLRA